MKKEIEKEKASSFAEGAISILTILENSTRPIEAVYLLDFKKLETDRKIARVKKLCGEKGIPFLKCDEEFINTNTVGSTHAGLIAEVGDRRYSEISSVFEKKDGFVCLIDGIEDPYNFAYSIRSLYAAGVDAVILSKRNWMTAAGVCIRGSAGATELVDCAVYEDKDELISTAKNAGYKIVCADVNTDTLYTAPVLSKPLFLIVGGEKRGISSAFMEAADDIVKINYGRDFPRALTAAAATSILAFEVLRQNQK